MSLSDVHAVFLRAVCLHEALRRLGVPPENIMLAPLVPHPDEKRAIILVQVRAHPEGPALISLDCEGTFPLVDIGPSWVRAVRAWSESNDGDLQDLWNGFLRNADITGILTTCADAGIVKGAPMPWASKSPK